MPAERLEDLADEAGGRPVRQADLAVGRQTRSNSLAACSWFGGNMTPKVETTPSNELSLKGSCSASAISYVTSSPSASARARPRASSVST
jgi:hypothetical protein